MVTKRTCPDCRERVTAYHPQCTECGHVATVQEDPLPHLYRLHMELTALEARTEYVKMDLAAGRVPHPSRACHRCWRPIHDSRCPDCDPSNRHIRRRYRG